MAQPGADRVDIHACAQQVDGSRMPDRMWGNTFNTEIWGGLIYRSPILPHNPMYSKTGQRLLGPSKEYSLFFISIACEKS
ncbi:hypothetical protein AA105894_2446 [Asaia spathodeae NBRC 105894]|nr:hypothetical protein AA105894_2446 [Asaia spathodeae NBRC 105894]